MIIKVPCLLAGVSTDTIARIMTKPSTNPKPKTGAEKYDTCIHSYVDEMMSIQNTSDSISSFIPFRSLHILCLDVNIEEFIKIRF